MVSLLKMCGQEHSVVGGGGLPLVLSPEEADELSFDAWEVDPRMGLARIELMSLLCAQ